MMRRSSGAVAFLAVGALALLSAGCYSYAQVEGARPDAGTRVRLRLTADGVRHVRERTGRELGARLEGRLLSSRGDSTVIRSEQAVRQPALGGGGSRSAVGSLRVSVPDSLVASVETRSFSAWKTGGLAAAGAVALRLFLELPDIVSTGGQGPIDQPPGGTPARGLPR